MICKRCKKDKAEVDFSAHPDCKSGYDTSACKQCKRSKADWSKVPIEKRIYNRAKSRAKRKGLDFNLELSDIRLPKLCPVLGVPFEYGHTDWTYSIDRINNTMGYVKGNIVIMSNKANRIKGDATPSELVKVAEWVKACEIM